MPSVMFDSSINIAALQMRHGAALELRRLAKGESIWLSSVELEELYVGANAKNRHVVERFERDFDRASRVLVRNLKDWTLLAARYDFDQIARGRLTNDALIAISAARTGTTVITANARDLKG
jgi:predicted nucleic acid-binding protein